MARWYSKIINTEDYFEVLGEAIEYFHDQYEHAQKELRPKSGDVIMAKSRDIPGIAEFRYGQLQEIEAILKYLEIQYDKLKGERKRNFIENYARQLTDRQADQYAEIEPEVIVIREFIQQVALVRNLFLGITKGLEYLHFQIGNIIKLRIAGIEDATF